MENLNYDSKSLFIHYIGEYSQKNVPCTINDEECDNYKFTIGVHLPMELSMSLNGGIVGMTCSKHLYVLVDIARDVMEQINYNIPSLAEYGSAQIDGVDEYMKKVERILYM